MHIPTAFVLAEHATAQHVNSAHPHAPVVPDRTPAARPGHSLRTGLASGLHHAANALNRAAAGLHRASGAVAPTKYRPTC